MKPPLCPARGAKLLAGQSKPLLCEALFKEKKAENKWHGKESAKFPPSAMEEWSGSCRTR